MGQTTNHSVVAALVTPIKVATLYATLEMSLKKMTKYNARQAGASENRDVASYASQTAREPTRTALSREQYLPPASNSPTEAAPRDNATNDIVLNVVKALLKSSRVVWGDLVTLLSLGVCIWFLLKMACQLLYR